MFAEQVIEPALAFPTGLERATATAENFLRSRGGLYPGGSFFASVAAEMAMRPGPVRDGRFRSWRSSPCVSRRPSTTPWPRVRSILPRIPGAPFELGSYLDHANAQFAISHESAPIDRARTLERRITERHPQLVVRLGG